MISLKYKIHISISPSQLPHGAEAAYGVTAEYYLLVCDEYALMVNVLGSIETSGICIVMYCCYFFNRSRRVCLATHCGVFLLAPPGALVFLVV